MYFNDGGKMYIIGTLEFSSMKDIHMTDNFEKIKYVEKVFNETIELTIATPTRLVRLRQAIESTREELLNCNALEYTDNIGPPVTIPRGREEREFEIPMWSSLGEDLERIV
ncbi:hypothetical protein M9H77_22633 [Catharanthus roseus]|uniref:Uncharacterized protein n=1 Tax=Catharanthus roseus TaxID=4058 RepID=A0ACC0AR08_CATRO|nr:hypothetical protein M9H77_22633 [Catharanthus roseus]